MFRRLNLVLVVAALASVGTVLGLVFGHEIARGVAVLISGYLAWKLLLGRAGFKSPGTVRRFWRLVETAWVAWVTVNVGRARRARIAPDECVPIAKLRPVYTGPGQTDEIPY